MKKAHRASPIILALLCAVGVHTVLFTDAGHRIQGAISESGNTLQADSSLVFDNGILSLKLQKDITSATKITATLGYNDESLVLSSPESTLGSITTKSEDFSQNVIVTLKNPTNLSKGTAVVTWKVTKMLPEVHTVNLTNTQVETTTGSQDLSTEGTGEF